MDKKTIVNSMLFRVHSYIKNGYLDVMSLAIDSDLETDIMDLIDIALEVQITLQSMGKIKPLQGKNLRANIEAALYELSKPPRKETECGLIKIGNIVFVKKLNTDKGYVNSYLVCHSIMHNVARFYDYNENGYVGEYRWDADQIEQLIKADLLVIYSA